MSYRDTNKSPNRKRTAMVAVCAVVLLLAGSYCGLCALAGGGNIYPNVVVGDVALGGMTVEEAQAAIAASDLADAPGENVGVKFTVQTAQGTTAEVAVPMSAVELDPALTARHAWNVGNEEGFFSKGLVFLTCLAAGADVPPAYGDSEALEAVLDDMDAQVGQAAVQPSWELGDTDLTITKGIPGNLLGRDDVKAEVFDRMGKGDTVDVTTAAPQFTMELEEALPEPLDLNDVLAQVETEVQNAELDIPGQRFQVDAKGISFDAPAAQEIFDAMDWGDTTAVPLIITEPTTTVADLAPQLYQDTLGTCSTNISGSENRVKNIALAAEIFNGTVLLPGEEFSYNGIVGSRQTSRGFLPAPAYVSGQTVQEIGGGVCQGSSTIYLAALRSNLEIVERYPHGYITRYVPDGMDATVYYGVKDFRFKNDTPFPIKVVGSVSGRTLTVNILGTKHNNITVEMTNETVGTTGYNTVYKVGSGLAAGATSVEVTPYAGYTIKTYRNLYEDGKLIDTKLEDTSVYRSRDKVVLVSPADAYKYGIPGYSAPAPKPDPAPAPAEPAPPAETAPPAEAAPAAPAETPAA